VDDLTRREVAEAEAQEKGLAEAWAKWLEESEW
jgi:molybdopterin-biosynthesis enzyme MoeA-like protein